MNTKRMIFVFGSALAAIGLLFVLFTSLSSAVSAQVSTPLESHNTESVAEDRWVVLTDMNTTRGDAGVVELNGKVHVVSGFFTNGFGYSSSQEVFDPLTNTWSYLWGFPNPRSDMVVVASGGKIYAIGGWNIDKGGSQSYNHVYDPTLNTWITKTSMITPVSGAGGVVISDSIYIIGGFDGTTNTRDVQIYNTMSDTWSLGNPLPNGRSEHEAVALDGQFYVIGGIRNEGNTSTTTNSVELYDPASGIWADGPALPDSRASMASVVRQEKIYIIGGTDNFASGNFTNTTFVYDPTSGMWSTVDSMPTARRAAGAAVLSDTIYVIGGVGETGAGTANEAYGNIEFIPSTISIVSDDPDPSQAYQPVVISYTVPAITSIPTGWVTVTVSQSPQHCSGQLVNGVGSCEIMFDTPGTYTLTATYAGDDIYSSSSDSESHLVMKSETTTTIIEDEPDPSLEGQPISVTVQVSSTYGLPIGIVTVSASNSPQTCIAELTNGLGGCMIALDTLGMYTITAAYEGDVAFESSSVTTTHLVVDFLRNYIPLILQE